MNSFQIKIIALSAMVIDHVGMFFLPDISLFRMVGRISFPLFAWLVGNGAHHTKNIKAYATRLLIFALISQIPYLAANRLVVDGFFRLNILFTLFLGTIAIYFLKVGINPVLKWGAPLVLAVVSHLIQADFGFTGVLMVVAFYVFYRHFRKTSLALSAIALVNLIASAKPGAGIISVDISQVIGLLALPIIWAYNQQQGPKAKHLFYVFYPTQYILLYAIKLLLKSRAV
ncbi:MAG TPA: TraX family protein [Patescibacteria group bacterium]|nr:TraX family protein [Patescibacteria group bacterium]